MAVETRELAAEQPLPEVAPLQAERPARLLLAGAPGLARQLQQQLPPQWEIVLVRPDADEAEGDFSRYRGDPTSALALQRAGAGEARVLIAALPDPDENLEVCRLAVAQLKVPSVLAVVPGQSDAEPYRAVGAEVIATNAVLATALRNLVDRGSAVAQEVGLSQGEILQITLESSSPIVGRRLRALRPRGWNVAAIFRGDALVLPEPATQLRANDRLLLVGEPERLRFIGEYLRLGRARFPLPYGSRIAGVLWGAPAPVLLQETAYLAERCGVAELSFTVCGDPHPWQEATARLDLPLQFDWSRSAATPTEAVTETLAQDGLGCLVLPPDRARRPRPFAGVARPLARALARSTVPIFIPRGSSPFEQVLLPLFRAPVPPGPVQAAFDLAEQLGAALVTAHVQAPGYLAEHGDDSAVVAAAIDETAALRRRQVQHERRTGNPLAELQRLAQPHQLLVIGHRHGRRWRLFRPDVSAYLAQRYPASTLVLPVEA